jgi:hypothetical protein
MFTKTKIEDLSKESLDKVRKLMMLWMIKLDASKVQIYPLNEKECEVLEEKWNFKKK